MDQSSGEFPEVPESERDDQILRRLSALASAEAASRQVQYDHVMQYVEKTLHLVSRHFDLYAARSGRPYYPLNDGWGLTSLASRQPFFVNTVDRNITPWIIMGGHWERNVERVLSSYTRPGMTVLDIGAHMGYYTVLLGAKVGRTGSLLAFEPNPEVSSVCEENIKINGLSAHVELRKCALGDVGGTARLTRSHSNMASANLLGEQQADFEVDVEVFRLDDIFAADKRVNLIKLDAEGYEKKILDGAQRTLARSIDTAVMIELGLERWERNAALTDLVPLCGRGKTLYAVHDDGTIEETGVPALREFLLKCDFHENYFFILARDLAERLVGGLIRRPG